MMPPVHRYIVASSLLLVALLLLLAAGPARATQVTRSWTLPTQNEDNSPIPTSGSGALTATRVQWGTCSGTSFGTAAGEMLVNVPATSATITGLTPGAVICIRAFARNNLGQESSASNVVQATVPTPKPKPPVLSSTSNVAWEYRRTGRKEHLRVVGTVPIGTPCRATAYVVDGLTYHEIEDRSQVTVLRGNPRVLVTMCGYA